MSRSDLPFPSNDPASPGSSTVRAPFPPYAPPARAYHASRLRPFRQTVFASSAILPAGCLYVWLVPCCYVLLGAMDYRKCCGWLGQQAGYTFHCAEMWGAGGDDHPGVCASALDGHSRTRQGSWKPRSVGPPFIRPDVWITRPPSQPSPFYPYQNVGRFAWVAQPSFGAHDALRNLHLGAEKGRALAAIEPTQPQWLRAALEWSYMWFRTFHHFSVHFQYWSWNTMSSRMLRSGIRSEILDLPLPCRHGKERQKEERDYSPSACPVPPVLKMHLLRPRASTWRCRLACKRSAIGGN